MQDNINITLKPIIEADPVVFSFNTTGWKVMFLLLFLAILFLIYKYYLHYKSQQYRRDAIQTIHKLNDKSPISTFELLTQIMFQIKQTALQTYGRKTVASLGGINWLQFLDEKVKGCHFVENHAVILNAVYKNEFDESINFNRIDFVNNAIKWLKEHA